MKKNIFIVIMLVVAFFTSLFVFNGCAKKEDNVLKIGAILPLTGNLASLGEKENRMLKFIETYVNGKKLFPKKLIIDVQDAKGDAKISATIAQKFVTQNIDYTIVSTTPLSAAVVPILERNKKVTIIHSMTNSLLNNTELAVRIYPSINDEVDCISLWLSDKLPDKIYFLRVKGEFSELWVKIFRDKNTSIISQDEEYTLTNLDLKNIAPKIKRFNPEYIILLGYGSEYPQLLKQLKEYKITSKILSNIGFAYSGNKEAAEKMNNLSLLQNVIFPFMQINKNDKLFQELDSLYYQKYGREFFEEPGALYYYDTVMLLLKYMSFKSNNTIGFRKFLAEEVRQYKGLTGEIVFNKNGDVKISLAPAYISKEMQIEYIK